MDCHVHAPLRKTYKNFGDFIHFPFGAIIRSKFQFVQYFMTKLISCERFVMESWLTQSEELVRKPGCLTQEHLLKLDQEQSYNTSENTVQCH